MLPRVRILIWYFICILSWEIPFEKKTVELNFKKNKSNSFGSTLVMHSIGFFCLFVLCKGLLQFYHFWRSDSMKRTSHAQYLHCRSLVSMSSSSDRKSTTRMTQATRTQLKPALSRQTCHRATRRPQQGFSQFDLWEGNVHAFSRADSGSRSLASLRLKLWRVASRGQQSSLMKRDLCLKPEEVFRGQRGPVRKPLDRLLWPEYRWTQRWREPL